MSLLTDALAVARLTRLVTRDEIGRPLRWTVLSAVDAGDLPAWAENLIDCPWCVAVWVALGVGVARAVAPRAWAPASRALAVSQLAGMLLAR